MTVSTLRVGRRGAGALAVALAALIYIAPPSLAAEGGPSQNIPIPATAGSGGTTVPAITVPAATPAPTTTPAATTPNALGSFTLTQTRTAHAGRSSGTSNTAIALAAIGALLVLCCAAWGYVRLRGIEPHWTLSLRHSVAEAGHRASVTWSELGDWMRLGR